MKIVYDQEVDVLRILLRKAAIEESDEDKPGLILDCDSDGNVVGLEVGRPEVPQLRGGGVIGPAIAASLSKAAAPHYVISSGAEKSKALHDRATWLNTMSTS